MDIEFPTTMHIAGGSQTKQVWCLAKGPNEIQYYTYSYPEGVDIYRSEWRLINGWKLVEANNSTMIRNFNVQNFECLTQEDMVYKPELKVWFPIISIIIFYFIVRLIFRLLRGKGL